MHRAIPGVLATLLYLVNSLPVVMGKLFTPPGHRALWIGRETDVAQYLTWMAAYRSGGLSPNYHAPWLTEPALFNPLLWVVAQVADLTSAPPVAVYQTARFLLYIAAGYGLFALLRETTENRREAGTGVALGLCSVPLQSVFVLPLIVVTLGSWDRLMGLRDFAFSTADGFTHGLGSSALVTFGTATTLFAFTFLARYLAHGRERDLVFASAVAFLSALGHPFEFVVIVVAGSTAILVVLRRSPAVAIRAVAVLGLASAAGVAPHGWLALSHDWLRSAALLNRWSPGPPHLYLIALGAPTLAVFALLFRRLLTRRPVTRPSDVLLVAWVLAATLIPYIPGMVWGQHLLDGYHYAIGILLVRLALDEPLLASWSAQWPRLARASIVGAVVLSLAPHVLFRVQNARDGMAATPERLFTSVMPDQEARAIEWVQARGDVDDLVLAPRETAPWVATAPMHSFASHYLFSIEFDEQSAEADRFFSGVLDGEGAREMLERYGIRWAIIPEESPAITYFPDLDAVAEIGNWHVYHFPDHAMRSFSEVFD